VAVESDARVDAIFVDDFLKDDKGKMSRLAHLSVPILRELAGDYCMIVAFSQDWPVELEYTSSLRDLGADFTEDRPAVVKQSHLWADRARALAKSRLTPMELNIEQTLRTRAAVEAIGEDSVKLVIKSLIGTRDASIAALAGGMSGDFVFRVARSGAGPGTPEENYVLKVSRDESALSKELNGAPAQSTQFLAVGLTQMSNGPVNGWWAGIGPLVPNNRTLEDLIVSTSSDRTIDRTARTLWKATMCRAFRVATTLEPELLRLHRLSARFAFAIDGTCTEVGILVRKVFGLKTLADEIEFVRLNVTRKEGTIWPFRSDDELWCESHGDFHPRNVLWSANSPFVIDWARAGLAPRCTDVACMATDLFIRVAEPTARENWDMSRTESDLETTWSALSARKRLPRSARPGVKFAAALFDAAVEEGALIPELHRALTFQMLRYARFSSLPLPRRALALACAARLVRAHNG
jgi:hypothetical protein